MRRSLAAINRSTEYSLRFIAKDWVALLRGRWLKRWVSALDRWLRRRQRVFEYTSRRDCVFRCQSTTAERHLRLRDGSSIAPGDPVLTLHFWNDNMPLIGEEGPTLAWARRFGRGIDSSLAELASFLRRRPDLSGVVAIRIEMALGDEARNEQSARILERFGFEWAPGREGKPIGYFRRLGDNAMVLLLILAFNPNADRGSLFRRERGVVYLARSALERRYPFGSGSE